MNELVVANEVCSHCGQQLVDGSAPRPDGESPRTSHAVVPVNYGGQPVPAAPPPAMGLSCLDNRWLVVGLLLVAGPAGLPALWFSRRFSKGVKIAATVAYALLTVAMPIAMIWYWCDTKVRPLVDVLAE